MSPVACFPFFCLLRRHHVWVLRKCAELRLVGLKNTFIYTYNKPTPKLCNDRSICTHRKLCANFNEHHVNSMWVMPTNQCPFVDSDFIVRNDKYCPQFTRLVHDLVTNDSRKLTRVKIFKLFKIICRHDTHLRILYTHFTLRPDKFTHSHAKNSCQCVPLLRARVSAA